MPKWIALEPIFQSERTLIIRVKNSETGELGIAKLSAKEHPSPLENASLLHEAEVLNQLAGHPGITSARETIFVQGRQALLFELADRSPVSKHEKWGSSLEAFFKFAYSVVKTLEFIHQKGFIHKDINPSNLLTNLDFSAFWMIDFSIASKAQRELQVFKPYSQLEGTFAYLSPEQSGRTNRTLDYRTDYYSLGITFFEALSRTQPFGAGDAMDVIYKHLTEPLPPCSLKGQPIPKSLFQILHKLTAKDPDDRYQSSRGILHDLALSEDRIKKGQLDLPIEIAVEDFSEQLRMSEKIYGRTREFEELKAAIPPQNRNSTAVLISGPSGSGKSALVHQLLHPVSIQGGYLIESKIDQNQRDSILCGFRSGLPRLFKYLMEEPRGPLPKIRKALDEQVGENIGALTELFPELGESLGKHIRPESLSPKETKKRILEVFVAVFRIICEYKFVVFSIDDIQWADQTTLEVMIHLAQAAIPGLLLLGVVRQEDLATPAIQLLISELKSKLKRVQLDLLDSKSIAQFLKDTLGSTEDSHRLGELLLKKCHGNPFYIRRVIADLYSEDKIHRSAESKSWKIRLEDLESLQMSDNVVELIASKLTSLDPLSKSFLAWASAYGAKFTLGQVLPHLQSNARSLAENALQITEVLIKEDFIQPIGPAYQHLISTRLYNPLEDYAFQFSHDRIQQSVDSLASPAERCQIHFQIGEHLSKQKLANPIEIAEHFLKANLGELTPSQKRSVSENFLSAAVLAKSSGAFHKAFAYAEQALLHSDFQSWNTGNDWMRSLYEELADIALLAGERSRSETYATELLTHSRTPTEKAEAHSILAHRALNSDQLQEAIDQAIRGMNYLGYHFEFETSPIRVILEILRTVPPFIKLLRHPKRFNSILDLPRCSKRDALLFAKIRVTLGLASFYKGKSHLGARLALIGFRKMLEDGLTQNSILNLSSISRILNLVFKNFRLSKEIGDVALKLMSHPVSDSPQISNLAYAFWAGINGYLHYPREEMVEHLKKIFDLATISRQYQGINTAYILLDTAAPGQPLSRLAEFSHYASQIKLMAYYTADVAFTTFYNLYSMMHERNSQREDQLLHSLLEMKQEQVRRADVVITHLLSYAISVAQFLLGNPTAAHLELRDTAANSAPLSGLHTRFKIEFLYCLVSLVCQNERLAPEVNTKFISKTRIRLKKLHKHNPDNFSSSFFLLEAEAAISNSALEYKVGQLYQKAIDAAKSEGDFLMEGIACERASDYFRHLGHPHFEHYYLVRTFQVYSSWEAWAKVRQLQTKHPVLKQLLEEGHTQTLSYSSITQNRSHLLDFEALVKATSSLSSEVSTPLLIEQITKTALEISGAKRAVLLLRQQSGEFSVYGTSQSSQAIVDYPGQFCERAALRKGTLLFEPTQKLTSVQDDEAYFKALKIRSAIAIPVLNHGSSIAVLYLEHDELSGIFSTGNIKAISLLVSQAAISLSNAELYHSLETRVAERTTQLNSKVRDTVAILNHLRQGVFSILPGCIIHPEYSNYLETILEETGLAGRNPIPLLFNHPSTGPNRLSQILQALEVSLGSAGINFEGNAHHLPRELTRFRKLRPGSETSEQMLEIEWQSILDQNNETEKILVCIRDVTEIRKLQQETRIQKLELLMLGEILDCGVESFIQARDNALNTLESISEGLDSPGNLPPLFRKLHTLKGNLGNFGLSRIVDAVHLAENQIVELRQSDRDSLSVEKGQEIIQAIGQVLEAYQSVFTKKMNLQAQTLLTRAHRETIHPKLTSELTSLSDLLKADIAALPRLAARLGKDTPKLRLIDSPPENPNCRYLIKSTYREACQEVFVHLFRNALDHGIETPDVRQSKGKSPSGRILIALRPVGRAFELTFSDDGQGLNLDLLRSFGLRQKLISEASSDESIATLIFETGLTTAEKANEISGRGMGLDIVKDRLLKLGADVKIHFTGEKDQEGRRSFEFVFKIPESWVGIRETRAAA